MVRDDIEAPESSPQDTPAPAATPSNSQLERLIRDMIVERQRLLIRDANYLRGLVGSPPVASVTANERKQEKDGSRHQP